MKRIIGCAVLGLCLALPNVSFAHGYHHGGRGYHHDGPGLIGGLIALPFVVAAAAVGTAAAIAAAPFDGPDYAPQPTYYQPPAAYYPPPVYYNLPPRVYYPQPGYYAPPPVVYAQPRVVYTQPRVVYRPYYAPAPVAPAYYEQAPASY